MATIDATATWGRGPAWITTVVNERKAQMLRITRFWTWILWKKRQSRWVVCGIEIWCGLFNSLHGCSQWSEMVDCFNTVFIRMSTTWIWRINSIYLFPIQTQLEGYRVASVTVVKKKKRKKKDRKEREKEQNKEEKKKKWSPVSFSPLASYFFLFISDSDFVIPSSYFVDMVIFITYSRTDYTKLLSMI